MVSAIPCDILYQAQTHRHHFNTEQQERSPAVHTPLCSHPAPLSILESKAWLQKDSDEFSLSKEPQF